MTHKYPFTKQDGLKNCACACIQMMVKYYKGYISMEELESRLKTNRLGTNALQMKEVMEELGFSCEGYKLDSIDTNMQVPFIAHVIIEGKFNHFVVVYKIYKDKVLIADPGSSIKEMQLDDFKKIWDGIILTAHPIKPIIQSKKVKLSSFIINNLIEYKKEFIYISVISILFMIFTVISSFAIKFFFDMMEDKSMLLLLFILFLIINIFKILSNFFRTNLLIFINQKIDITMNMDIYKKVIYLPYQYFRNRTSGEIISKIIDLNKIRELINNLIFIVLFDLPLTITSGIILYRFSKKLFFPSLFVLFVYLVIYFISIKNIKTKTDKCLKEKADVSSYLFESINGFETVKNLNVENNVINNYDNKYTSYLKNIIKLDSFMNIQNLFKSINDEIGQLIIMYIGFILISKGSISVSDFLVFNSISVFFFSPIRNILSLDLSTSQANSAFKKAYEIVIDKKESGLKLSNIDNIIFNKLNYKYNYNNYVLKNISLNIKKGEKVLITGKSGAGKSTLLKLLLKYYDIDRNMIYLNNTDINDIKDTRNIFTYVSQNETLFTDSIYNNINVFNKDTDIFSEVISLCKVDDVIKDSNLGLNMVIEENGFNISGGQKQRIILARALLSDFEVLLVDEGLSQIDISLEREIIKNIFNKYKDKTMIFISHRLENLDLYDRLIEIKDGKIVKNVKRI